MEEDKYVTEFIQDEINPILESMMVEIIVK